MKDGALGERVRSDLCMLDIVLHTGLEHPDIWWIVVPSLLTFLAGIGIGSVTGNEVPARRATDEINDR